jgi:SAM-dependent methyltransferase
MKLKEGWKNRTDRAVTEFLRDGYEGHRHPSRLKTITLLDGLHSVLDVGCGTGVMFEVLQITRPEMHYVGVDVTERFIEEARSRHPSYADRFLVRSVFELGSLQRTFDAVLCRHLLEHLPDYAPAIQEMYALAERKLIVIFYLPPRLLHWGRKRDEKFEEGYYAHTYDLGKFVDHVLHGLKPQPVEVSIHPGQGMSDPSLAWGGRENVIYEIVRRP